MRAIVRDRDNGIPLSAIARGFHDALCEMALDQCQTLNREHLPAALSGGVFLNRTLLDGVSDRLTAAGYRVLTHRRVSPGDEGLSLGQLAIAACQMNQRRNDHVSCCSAYNSID